jgi:hypothetical protein
MSASEQRPSCKKHAGKNKVHAPPPWYKLYIRDDEDELYASMLSHQIGYGSKTCKHARYPYHHQKYLTTTTLDLNGLIKVTFQL